MPLEKYTLSLSWAASGKTKVNSNLLCQIPWAHGSVEGLDVAGLGLDLVEVEDLQVVLLSPKTKRFQD